jgi:hypothetical protein
MGTSVPVMMLSRLPHQRRRLLGRREVRLLQRVRVAVVDRLVGVADLEQLQQRGAQIGDRLFSRSAIADRSNARMEQAEARQTPSSSCSTT